MSLSRIGRIGCCLGAAAGQKPLRVIADVVVCVVQTLLRHLARQESAPTEFTHGPLTAKRTSCRVVKVNEDSFGKPASFASQIVQHTKA